MKIKYSTIAMSRNKNSSFRTAERVWKTLFKANVTVLLLVLIKNVNISRLNRIGRQLQPVELAAGELAVNWQTTSAWLSLAWVKRQHHNSTIDEPNEALSGGGGGSCHGVLPILCRCRSFNTSLCHLSLFLLSYAAASRPSRLSEFTVPEPPL